MFDWDGTLCDSLPAIYEANRIVLEELGLPFDDARYRAAYVPDWRLMYQRLGVPDGALDEAGRRWLALYAEAAEAGLLPRVRESLERPRCRIVLGLVTAGDRDVVSGQLERFDIAHLIPARVFGTDEIASKPHPDPLLRVLTELDRAERVATARYVGDVPDDMRMARAVGADRDRVVDRAPGGHARGGSERRLSAGRRLRGRPAGSRRHGERCRLTAGRPSSSPTGQSLIEPSWMQRGRDGTTA